MLGPERACSRADQAEQRSPALQDAQSDTAGGNVGGSALEHPWRQQICGVLSGFSQGLLCSLPLSLPHG